jgi:hypothetical protein
VERGTLPPRETRRLGIHVAPRAAEAPRRRLVRARQFRRGVGAKGEVVAGGPKAWRKRCRWGAAGPLENRALRGGATTSWREGEPVAQALPHGEEEAVALARGEEEVVETFLAVGERASLPL